MSVVIHTKSNCSYCVKAKEFLNNVHVPYTEVFYDPLLESYEMKKNELVQTTNHHTFPQIFVGSYFIGGYSELVNAYSTLKLHELCKEIGIDIEYDF